MPLSKTQIDQVHQSTQNWVGLASNLYKLHLPEIEVHFDLRGRTSGMFCHRHKHSFIRYNSSIFARHFEESINQTIPHEVAHYVVFKRYGTRAKPHGLEWKQVMSDFGVPADVTSKLDVKDLSVRQLRRYIYRCGCSQHELTSIRHNRILRGTRQYGCPKCRQPLTAES